MMLFIRSNIISSCFNNFN